MHPRAIVGPPGTTPQLNPYTGMPQLRRSRSGRGRRETGIYTGEVILNPTLQFGSGAPVQVPTNSTQVDAPPIQANPGQTTGSINGRLLNPASQGGAVSVGACFPKFDPLEMYGVGQELAPNPMPVGVFPTLEASTGMPRLRARRRGAVPTAR